MQIKHDTKISLNDVHVLTGFVTVEEVLRFCIVDLGVPPLSPTVVMFAIRSPPKNGARCRVMCRSTSTSERLPLTR
jgi:hypothetical protein